MQAGNEMRLFNPYIILLLAVLLYLAGLFLSYKPDIEHLKHCGVASQELRLCYDSDGDEYESESLIEIRGIGPILTYSDIYIATVPFLIISLVLAKVVFNSTDEVRFAIFTNCILGALLLWLTTKPNIISTILYWCGIITASFIPKNNEHKTSKAKETF